MPPLYMLAGFFPYSFRQGFSYCFGQHLVSPGFQEVDCGGKEVLLMLEAALEQGHGIGKSERRLDQSADASINDGAA